MIKVEWFYWLCGLLFVLIALQVVNDRGNPKRLGSAAFWGLLGLSFGYGTFVVHKQAPAWVLGIAVIVIAVLAGFGFPTRGQERTTTPAEREHFANKFGNKLFLPALVIPVVAAIFGAWLAKVELGNGKPLLETGSATIIGLGVASILALIVGMVLFRPKSLAAPLHEGRRLLEHIGWAAILPQMLATLGLLFTASGVGKAVGHVTNHLIPKGSLIAAVALYCIGMAIFTIIMGNAFAAFPVMTAAVGWPLLVQQFHGTPAVVFAIGMLAGFCGTLCTPMAANFNLVPAALLEMKDQYGPIKAQIPTAIPLLACNIVLMYVFAF
ncbi:DUF979 domain-containing protein [Kribbella jejuensis]|uniref:Putative membrane protein n=1 Tax=Kribbella jejuensis TaxID=236068 RepID=A0A542E7P1_9ACTN|nr:DUF979 domain-containing protein [Kribbella jejuensis]TQJ11334.1 putative membrane protein [Kribbella jejuensis]